MKPIASTLLVLFSTLVFCMAQSEDVVDATTLRHKVLCGYQGWFACPGDGSNLGWSHWSNHGPLTTATGSVHVEYWPDMSEYSREECFPAPGYTYPDGKQAMLFSSVNPLTVLRHFQWMRQYGLDGVFLQRFLVGLPGAKGESVYQERLAVINNVRMAANQTGRVWAINYDTVSVPTAQIFDLLTTDWKKMMDWKITEDPRYIHEKGLPVVHIWWNEGTKNMTPEVLNRLIDFFKAPGPCHAYVVAGGIHNWRQSGPEWIQAIERLDAHVPWNVGNYYKDKEGVAHAQTNAWEGDWEEMTRHGVLWIPVVYSGFSWNNLQKRPWDKNGIIPRRKGAFLWEQFYKLSQMKDVDTIFLAMFDEMDEGTAILKVTNTPPTQANFLTYEGLPTDWYMRLVGLGGKMLREKMPVPAEIPIKP